MSALEKRQGTIRLTGDTWMLLDKIRKKEGWTKSMAIQEIIKDYSKRNNITLEKENEND